MFLWIVRSSSNIPWIFWGNYCITVNTGSYQQCLLYYKDASTDDASLDISYSNALSGHVFLLYHQELWCDQQWTKSVPSSMHGPLYPPIVVESLQPQERLTDLDHKVCSGQCEPYCSPKRESQAARLTSALLWILCVQVHSVFITHESTHVTCVFRLKGCISLDEKCSNPSMALLCSNVKRGELKRSPE